MTFAGCPHGVDGIDEEEISSSETVTPGLHVRFGLGGFAF